MATEINRELFDFLLKQQIATGRYATQLVSDTVSLLNAADREIMAKIVSRGEDGTITTARLNALLREIRQMVDDSYWQAEKRLHDEMGGFVVHSAASTVDVLSAQVPVAFSAVGMSPEQLTAIVSKTPISIGPDKKLLLEEIFKSLASGKEEAIRGAVRLGMVQGESMAEITRRLMGTRAARYQDGIIDTHRRHASNIVRSVVQHTNNTAVAATFANNKDIVRGWVYVATLDSRTCSVCFSQSGKEFELGKGPIPIRHVSCRCYQIPRVATWRELGVDLDEMPAGKRASKGGLVDADISFHSWLKGESEKTQVDLLGKTRQKLFADGGLKIDRFTDTSGKLYTLDALKQKNAAAFARAFGN